MASAATKAITFLSGLRVPEGPRAGRLVELAPFQKRFVRGALAAKIRVSVLSVARGNGKSAITSGLGLGELLGEFGRQPRREVLLAARTRDQARICFDFCVGFARTLPEEQQARLSIRRSPRLEIEYEDDDGSHYLRALAADGKSALGTAPTLVLMDERGHWPRDLGDQEVSGLPGGLKSQGNRVNELVTRG